MVLNLNTSREKELSYIIPKMESLNKLIPYLGPKENNSNIIMRKIISNESNERKTPIWEDMGVLAAYFGEKRNLWDIVRAGYKLWNTFGGNWTREQRDEWITARQVEYERGYDRHLASLRPIELLLPKKYIKRRK